ncbi:MULTISPECIES: dihydroxyacetone kinase phosphoryl donor subunit DhaM [unclassified Leifsonia]|uniref:dihydroxyacetone kinase phosphoryl donor subunit DhaM n=1 Tax=unclassified Leifsonia TaxID=2663824 RepID=UPI0008A77FD2|nr:MULTISPECIES: dihydroxyacetone kinase phosphoryl donor subunit DhaM [unclassified Leifsonia]SEH97563.1 Phosphocarrier protein HPr /dihydroxyacetone kinase DhaM subunit [Leifsonia sp. CL154]SFL62851.1 Phosphocarrier protein HPr /dihydroxyacetone kinase DhaM subunit [Leifsonia sp. CL147]
MTATVGIVFVSHSSQIAAGMVELARQMAGSVRLVAAGGTDDDGIGTSFAKVMSGVSEADGGEGVVVVSDLGSALLTAETVLDMLDEGQRSRVRVVDVPFVEGGVAAAVAAESGGTLDAVVAAAEGAVDAWAAKPAAEAAESPADAGGPYEREVLVRNPEGLHARPAAEFVKLANTFPSKVTVNGKDAKSLLGIMSLGLTAGSTARIASADPGGRPAVDALADLVDTGFGEV